MFNCIIPFHVILVNHTRYAVGVFARGRVVRYDYGALPQAKAHALRFTTDALRGATNGCISAHRQEQPTTNPYAHCDIGVTGTEFVCLAGVSSSVGSSISSEALA